MLKRTFFDLEDYMGVYAADLEACNLGDNDADLLLWPNYDGCTPDELVRKLFVAIRKFRTRSVWCLLDKYHVSPNSIDPQTGETALELATDLYEEHRDSSAYNMKPGLSCLRIIRMLRLKEGQCVTNQTSST